MPDADTDVARDLLIELEMFSGTESPDGDRERRRVLQIERLSARMRGSAEQPTQELAALLARWTALGASDAGFDARIDRALTIALDSLP